MSPYQCAFGISTCQDIDSTNVDAGCCGHGASITDEEDHKRVIDVARRMESDPAEPQWWQNRPKQTLKWPETYETDPSEPLEPWLVWDELDDKDGEPEPTLKTRVAKNACIFANRDGRRNDADYATHQQAMANDIDLVKVKLGVCWQVLLRRLENWEERPGDQEILRMTIIEYSRRAWGDDGEDFEWFCTNTLATRTGGKPMWRTHKSELAELIDKERCEILMEHCRAREVTGTAQTFEPSGYPLLTTHPATRVVAEGLAPDKV